MSAGEKLAAEIEPVVMDIIMAHASEIGWLSKEKLAGWVIAGAQRGIDSYQRHKRGEALRRIRRP